MEQSWCFRGEEEKRSATSLRPGMRLSLAKPSLPIASAKVLLFSDMAMGWSGLRALLVRIACMCPNDWAKQEKNTRSNRSNIGNYAEYDKIQ